MIEQLPTSFDELVQFIAVALAGGLGFAIMQGVKWVLAQYGKILEGRLAFNITLGLSAVLGIGSTGIAYAVTGLSFPVTWEGWTGLLGQAALAIVGAATVVYKELRK